MEECNWDLRESFERFEKAAKKGHDESQWLWDVVKDMDLDSENREAFKEAFAKMECCMG
jgi:hypothetical protein